MNTQFTNTFQRDADAGQTSSLPPVVCPSALQELIKESLYIAWKDAQNRHRLYPDNKHTFFEFMDISGRELITELESKLKQSAIDFNKFYNSLSPSAKCTVHPPAGSGMSSGIYELTDGDIYNKFISKK